MQKRQMITKVTIIMFAFLLAFPKNGISGSAGDYLVMQNINAYKMMGSGGGKGSGIVSATDHFSMDHTDESYDAIYFHDANEIGVQVQVTHHAGGDSDKWLLHEVDSAFRDKYGIPAVSYYPWQIDSQTVLINAVGGREYRWLSGYKVVELEYHGSLTQTPEPLEVVKAYLAKHPSTLPAMALSQLRSANSKTNWIKDEMDRRLWLCDKWFGQLSAGKTDQNTALDAVVKSMNVFLDYREKYFGISAKNEKTTLEAALYQNNLAAVQAKLTEYKTWWTAHKGDSITL